MAKDDNSRALGKVIYVSADRLTVELHRGSDNFTVIGFDDIHYVARLGSYLLIPVQAEYVVAEVVGLREKDAGGGELSGNHSRLNKQNSAKYLDLEPVGMLPNDGDAPFRFGVSKFPSLYADALYAKDIDLDRIFDVRSPEEVIPEQPYGDGDGIVTRYRALSIGESVVFQGYHIKARIDEMFGGHAAVLGNTGSGKSCTVASIIQSLFGKTSDRPAQGASFLIFDINGEYRRAFTKLPAAIKRLYLKVEDDPLSEAPTPGENETTAVFRLPHWFMSAEEWELLLQASERTQRPVLRTALGLSTLFSQEYDQQLNDIKNHIIGSCISGILDSELGSPAKSDRIKSILFQFHTEELQLDTIRQHVEISYGEMADVEALKALVDVHIQQEISIPSYRNAQFEFEHLSAALDLALLYEEAHGNRQIRDYCSQMVTRLKSISERDEFAFLRVNPASLSDLEKNTSTFVDRLMGFESEQDQSNKDKQIIVIDFNDAADEVVEVAAAVLARMVFERLRRADPRNEQPVNLILEEAHRYIAQTKTEYAIDSSRIFERIAKEGRKYGVFLMLASQRPSELSKTVLSQCSNFIVHRIQNPDDLTHIRQMTPFISESVLKRLPSLPKQHALVFGNAVNLPTTFRVRDVDPKPKSDDANIREIWFGVQ